jgi:hypothetical protein
MRRSLLLLSLSLSLPSSLAAEQGGEALVRFEAEQVLTRLRPAVRHEAAPGVLLFAQGQWYGTDGGSGEGTASVYQAHLDLARGGFLVRAGRQEIVLGSGFLLGADTFHDGASFDAVRITQRLPRGASLDAFAGRHVPENSGGTEGGLQGLTLRLGDPGARALELLALRDRGGDASTDTVSLRVLAARGPFRLEVEPARQRGAWGGQAELSWAGVTAAYAFASPEFRHPHHDTGHVGDIGVFGDLSGIAARSLGAALPLGERTRLTTTLRAFRGSGELGREVDLVLSRSFGEHVSVTASLDRFRGRGLLQGQRIAYGYLSLALAF